jgi:hypothetical protein
MASACHLVKKRLGIQLSKKVMVTEGGQSICLTWEASWFLIDGKVLVRDIYGTPH